MGKIHVLLVLFFLEGQLALAGWSSGGGELIADRQNPWFIQNTQNVTYCIKVHSDFGQSLDHARQYIPSAFSYWKRQFSQVKPMYSNGAPKPIEIGTQVFSETACTENVDIRFQLGFLTKEQQQRIGHQRKFIGLTVRTDYDKKHLRGKGFVYLAPQQGELALDDPRLIQNPWSYAFYRSQS